MLGHHTCLHPPMIAIILKFCNELMHLSYKQHKVLPNWFLKYGLSLLLLEALTKTFTGSMKNELNNTPHTLSCEMETKEDS